MNLFNFFKRKPLSNEEIEKEYDKAQRNLQSETMPSLNRAIERHAESTHIPQKGDDLLAKKASFIRMYSFIARTNRYYHSLNYKKGKFNTNPLWCQKWHDYEQDARLAAQRRWRELSSHIR